jgi:hypothetical protein
MDWQASMTSQGKRQQLMLEERQRRFEQGLCFYCGSDKYKQFYCSERNKARGSTPQRTQLAASPQAAATSSSTPSITSESTLVPSLSVPSRSPSIAVTLQHAFVEFDLSENE